jgi:hypothetical protein
MHFANYAQEVSRHAQPQRSPLTADAGGERPVTSDFTLRIRTRTSGGVGGEQVDKPPAPYPNSTPCR